MMATKRVLIIDDEPGIRRILQISLKALTSWEVLVASSGSAGLEIATAERPDVILLDMMMPGMDGVTTLHRLREQIGIQHIPIIILTAKAQASEQQEFSHLAIQGVITKPFKAVNLVDQIRSLLNWDD